MKKRRNGITAEELMNQLANDPEYQRIRAHKDEKSRIRRERLDADQKPVLDRLAAVGFPVDSTTKLFSTYGLLPEVVVEILLDSLNSRRENRIKECIVRELCTAKTTFDGRPLAICFDTTTDDEGVRWAIVNTIAITHPANIDDWIAKLQENDYWRKTLSDLGYGKKRT